MPLLGLACLAGASTGAGSAISTVRDRRGFVEDCCGWEWLQTFGSLRFGLSCKTWRDYSGVVRLEDQREMKIVVITRVNPAKNTSVG